ncbi:MAG: hypothetical protein ACOYT4_02470 [Nanoarchaeota archaeon]
MIKAEKECVLIKPEDIKPSSKDFEVIGAINPGAIRISDGRIVLYVRIIEKLKKASDKKYFYSPRMVGKDEFKIKIDKFSKKIVTDNSELDFSFKDGTKRLTFISHFRRVILAENGFKIISIDEKPSFFGVEWDGELGIEDPRITKIGNLYFMTYVSLSRNENVSTSYSISNDCINWYRRGIIFGEQDKDVVLFPEMINDKYIAFDRPEGSFQFTLPHIWVSYSANLEFWGKPKPIELYKPGDWDEGKNGSGPPPIKTAKGWLLLYHAITEKSKIKKEIFIIKFIKKFMRIKEIEKIPIYAIGAALFDLNDPEKLISKSKEPIFIPSKKYEKDIFGERGIIFPTGLVPDSQMKNILVYSGAGDSLTTVKKVSLKKILSSLRKV